jgi:hypothetical protein
MKGLNMKDHLAYAKYVFRHKWFVLVECLKLGVPIWIAILHDWDRFLPGQWMAYVHFFYALDGSKIQRRDSKGYYSPYNTGDKRFDLAVFRHLTGNKHHWQHWCLACDCQGATCLPIPDVYIREMIADWRGAAKAQGRPDPSVWYQANRHNLQLHPCSRAQVEQLLGL